MAQCSNLPLGTAPHAAEAVIRYAGLSPAHGSIRVGLLATLVRGRHSHWHTQYMHASAMWRTATLHSCYVLCAKLLQQQARYVLRASTVWG